MEDRYIQILAELHARGVNVEQEITDTLYRLYTNQPDLPPNQVWNGVEHDIKDMLNLMLGNKHIKYREMPYRAEDTHGTVTTTPHIYAEITFDGFNYLDNYRLTKSNIKLNGSLRFYSGIQTTAIVLAAILAGFSLFVSIKTYARDNNEQSLSIRIERLKQDSIKLQGLLSLKK